MQTRVAFRAVAEEMVDEGRLAYRVLSDEEHEGLGFDVVVLQWRREEVAVTVILLQRKEMALVNLWSRARVRGGKRSEDEPG
jgi:hypothetical protein